MRILILSIIFLSAFYYFSPRPNEESSTARIDLVKVKMAAPERKTTASNERVLTVREKTKTRPGEQSKIEEDSADFEEEPVDNYEEDLNENLATEASEDSEADLPRETSMTDLEEGWNGELLTILGRLEPYEAEALHKSYLQEKEAYHKGLEAMLNEGQNSAEAALELEQIQAELEQQHQEKLKNILGTHYESVMDQYHQFMEVTSQLK